MSKITLIYDGECPFCRRYAHYVRLKDISGGLDLVNARDSARPAVQEAMARGYNLDKGMVVVINGIYCHGEEALHVLGLMSSRSDLFNKINYRLFSSKKLSIIVYPFFRMMRNIVLFLKGVKKIHP